jgi:hypothetical protein
MRGLLSDSLHGKQRMAIVHVVLGKDACSHKDRLVLVNSMTEGLHKNLASFDTTIEDLVACAGSFLELFHFGSVEVVARTTNRRFPGVAAVGNQTFPRRYLAQQSVGLPEYGEITCCSREWAIDPDQLRFPNGNSDLIRKARLMELVRVP